MACVIRIEANWDPDAKVWVAESQDIPLVTEAPTIEAMLAKLPGIIQDLLEDEAAEDQTVPFELVAHSRGKVDVRAA